MELLLQYRLATELSLSEDPSEDPEEKPGVTRLHKFFTSNRIHTKRFYLPSVKIPTLLLLNLASRAPFFKYVLQEKPV